MFGVLFEMFHTFFPKNWVHWLALAEYWYNTYHTALANTSFEIIYGHKPRDFGVLHLEECSVPDLASWLKEREVVHQLLHQQFNRAKQRMKIQAVKHRTECHFEAGDQVYLKLEPHIQTSVAIRLNQKLAFRYYGSCEVLARIGTVAYKLKLPLDHKFTRSCTCSSWRKWWMTFLISPTLPPSIAVLQGDHEPEMVLACGSW